MEYFIARQAIFDNKQNVFGYELTFRSGLLEVKKNNIFDDKSTSTVMTGGFLLVGIDEITANKKAFIHFTPTLLRNEAPKLFSPNQVAIQVAADDLEDPEIRTICQGLKKEGFSIILEEYYLHLDNELIIGLIDTIRIDYSLFSSMNITSELNELRKQGLSLLVFNVESWDDFKSAYEYGFDLFQGSFISKPFVLAGRDIPGFKVNYVQILEEISKGEINFTRLEDIIKRDVSLSYKLLRMINSSAFGFKNEITSIKQALAILGTREVKKWCSLVALSDLGSDRPDELIKTSLLRARFCELIGETTNKRNEAPDLFLMGLFSLITAFIPKPMTDIMAGLPVSKEIKDALLEQKGPYATIYNLMLNYEKGDLLEILTISNKMHLDDSVLPQLYFKSIEWVNQILK